MTTALILAPDRAPIISDAADVQSLLINLRNGRADLPDVFEDTDIADEAGLRSLINRLGAPSGLYDGPEEARAALEAWRLDRDARIVQAAQDRFGCTDREMTRILGLKDAAGDGAPVRKIRARRTGLSGPTQLCLAYALRYGPMSREDEAAAIDELGADDHGVGAA